MINTLTRRDFLQAAALTPLSAAWPEWMPRLAFGPEGSSKRGDVMVAVFLRGAADALNMVVPHGEDAYYRMRPTLNIPRPDDRKVAASERCLDLDGFFGLHPALASLWDAWQDQDLAIIHACGAPDESRSHFKAMALMERGVGDETGPASGWIGRHLASYDNGNASPLRAVGWGQQLPRSLYGSVPATALQSIVDYHLHGDAQAARQMQRVLGDLYTGHDTLAQVGKETLNVLDTLQLLDPNGYRPHADARYPESEFGHGMRQIAMLVKAQVGLEVATIDIGGWDTHFAQGSSSGLMAQLLGDLGGGLAAFHADMADYLDQMTLIVMSEFGRRVGENASLGTDHGHGGAIWLLGGNVVGGRIHGRWPGLAQGQLFGPGDLAVTTDYRDVLAELIGRRLNNPAVDQIFPDYSATFHGFLRG